MDGGGCGRFVRADTNEHRKPGDTGVGQFLILHGDCLANSGWQVSLDVRQTRAAGEANPVGESDEQRTESPLVAAPPRFMADDDRLTVLE